MMGNPIVIFEQLQVTLDSLLRGLEESKHWSLHVIAGTLKQLLEDYKESTDVIGTSEASTERVRPCPDHCQVESQGKI